MKTASAREVRKNPEKAIARIESFSDSIFGFAITLLVLELLQIPRPEIGEHLFESVSTHWQSFFAYLVGFCTILICWINHHHLFCHLVQYDGRFLWINGGLLLIVTFTPLPTALFSEFLLKQNGTGLILFGLTYFLISCVAYLMWTYAYNNNFLDSSVDKSYYRSIIIIFRYALWYTLVSFAICFVSNVVAIVMYLLMFGVFAFPHHFTLRYRQFIFRSRKVE
jgi:uncharacterized membrane protein